MQTRPPASRTFPIGPPNLTTVCRYMHHHNLSREFSGKERKVKLNTNLNEIKKSPQREMLRNYLLKKNLKFITLALGVEIDLSMSASSSNGINLPWISPKMNHQSSLWRN